MFFHFLIYFYLFQNKSCEDNWCRVFYVVFSSFVDPSRDSWEKECHITGSLMLVPKEPGKLLNRRLDWSTELRFYIPLHIDYPTVNVHWPALGLTLARYVEQTPQRGSTSSFDLYLTTATSSWIWSLFTCKSLVHGNMMNTLHYSTYESY